MTTIPMHDTDASLDIYRRGDVVGASPHAVGGHSQAVSASDEALYGQVERRVGLPHALFRPPRDLGVAYGAARRSDETGVGREQAMGPRAQRMVGRAQARGGSAEGVGACVDVRAVETVHFTARSGDRLLASVPHDGDLVGRERGVARHDDHVLRRSLRDEHSIEGIAVKRRQASQGIGVRGAHR